MRKKNLLEYILLGLFMLCMALALSASLEYVTRAREREYLFQGKYLFALLGISLAIFAAMRLTIKFALRTKEKTKVILTLATIALFFNAGLAARLVVIQRIPIQPASDFDTYYRLANFLLNDTLLTPEGEATRRYVALYPHTIGFPMMVLLPIFKIFGASVQNALYANLAFSMLSVLVAARIGWRCMGKTGAIVSAAAMSLWPSHILFSNMVATEPSFTLLLLIATNWMASALDRSEKSLFNQAPGRLAVQLIVLGIVLALASAIRPMAIILLAAFAVVHLCLGRAGSTKGNIGIRYALTKSYFCLLLIAIPYLLTGQIVNQTINDIILEEPASGLTASGYNLMVGVNVSSGGLWNEEDAAFFANAYARTESANAAHRLCMQEAILRVRQAPEDVLNLLVYKFRDLWQTDDFGIDWNLLWTEQQGLLTPELTQNLEKVRSVGRFAYMCILLYALIGAIIAWRRTRAPNPLQMLCILFFLGTALSHMLLETQVRYHYNTIPYLILLSAMTIAEWRQRVLDEPPVNTVIQQVPAESVMDGDHTRFDMHKALEEGHVVLSVSKAYTQKENEDT